MIGGGVIAVSGVIVGGTAIEGISVVVMEGSVACLLPVLQNKAHL